MSLMVTNGSEMIRYNPSSSSIEYSNTRGLSWMMRCRCSDMGNVRALTLHKGEVILCSDQGIYVSKNFGMAWFKRSSERNFVDIQDMGNELIVSTADLKYRPPYGKAYSEHRRFASFIGTTNESMPLTDPSGARRFVCVTVTGDIDFRSPVNYEQLYAQLYQEIRNGERYWPTREQEQSLMQHNLKFQQVSGLGEMLMAVIQKPQDDADGQWMTLKDISALLKKHFKGYKEEVGTFRKIGSFLSRPEYQFVSRHKTTGMVYWVKIR